MDHKKIIISAGIWMASALSLSAQTEVDLNPIYSKVPAIKLSLLLRESPQNLKKVYEKKPVANIQSKDSVMVAPKTGVAYGKLIASLHWNIVPVETTEDSIKSTPKVADSTLVRTINTAEFNMVRVPGDTMGHKSFLMGQTEVTQKLWIAVMYSNPSVFTEMESGWPCYNRPVENVSWQEVNQFIKKLNKQTGRHFRLPTVREWQYAANGASVKPTHLYAGSDSLNNIAWYKKNYIIGAGTRNVAQKAPNALGLYDMSGNVWEWCADHFMRSDAKYAIVTGGCATGLAKDCATDTKNVLTTNTRSQYIGFRLVEDE